MSRNKKTEHGPQTFRLPRPMVVALVAGAALTGLAWLLRLLWPAWWPVAIAADAMIVIVGWRRHWGRWRLLTTSSIVAWVGAAWALSPRPELVAVLASGLVAASAAWALRDRLRYGRDLAAVKSEWAAIAEAAGLPGSRFVPVARDRAGWSARVTLQAGRTVTEAVSRTDNLESALNRVVKVRPGAVQISRDVEQANACRLRIVMRDPLAEPQEWAGPHVTSVREEIPLGPDQEGGTARLSLVPKPGQALMVMIAGPNGSGKSELLNVMVGNLANCRDAVLWGADFKRTELTPWASCFDRLATTVDEAVAMLEAALRVIDARSKVLAGERRKSWRPSPGRPELVIILDEFADLAGRMDLVHEVIRKGRAFGVQLVLATQRPTSTALGDGGTDVRAEIRAYVCMRVERPEESDYVLGRGRSSEGWRADRLGEPGSFLLLSPRHRTPLPARCYLVGDRAESWAEQGAPMRPRLDLASAKAAYGWEEPDAA